MKSLLHVYHRPLGTPAHRGNSRRAITWALARDYTGIDVDVTMTRDGVLIANHWQRPMRFDRFRDSQRRIDPSRKVKTLTWAEVKRLRAPGVPPYRISRLRGLIRHTAEQQKQQGKTITLCLEIKPNDDRVTDYAIYRRIAAWSGLFGVRVIVMAQGRGDLWRIFRPAAQAGLTTMVQWRGRPIPADVAPYVHLAKYGPMVREVKR